MKEMPRRQLLFYSEGAQLRLENRQHGTADDLEGWVDLIMTSHPCSSNLLAYEDEARDNNRKRFIRAFADNLEPIRQSKYWFSLGMDMYIAIQLSDKKFAKILLFCLRLLMGNGGRRFFIPQSGCFGLGPSGMQKGDRIMFFSGVNWPMAMRTDGDKQTYRTRGNPRDDGRRSWGTEGSTLLFINQSHPSIPVTTL
jgi:hypothetical protein